jgi:hypothetical protein
MEVRIMSKPLDELNELLEKWFYKFDLQAVRILLGAASPCLPLFDPAAMRDPHKHEV